MCWEFLIWTALPFQSTRGNFLKKAEKNGDVITVSYELPKSFAVVSENGKTKVYISQLATSTLLKRSGFIDSL